MNINVGGYAFAIDDNAFHKLDNYLASLLRHFSKSDSSKEIMQDIEERIAELFKEKLQYKSIVGEDLVDQIIKTMGTPSDFISEDPLSHTNTKKNESEPLRFKPGKKLFRDLNDKKIAGVCSGLSHYLGIEDPIFIRLAFFFGLMAAGSTLLLYIILWFITKPAVTASDYLQMKGEPINIDSIASKVEEKIEQLTNKIESLMDKKSNK